MKILIALFFPFFIYAQTITLQILGYRSIPVIAYCINIDGKKIVFAGDTSAQIEKLETLAHVVK